MVESGTTQVSPISAAGPRDVVASFLKLTVDTPDFEKAKLHLTKKSAANASFKASDIPPGSTYTLGAEEADELGRRIPVKMKSPAGAGPAQEMTLPVIVVQEEGEWKVDMAATMDRMFGGAMDVMGKAMAAAGEALTTAMEGVGEVMAAGMGAVKAYKPVKKAMAREKKVVKAVKKMVKKVMKKMPKKAAKKVVKKVAKKKAAKPVKKAAKKPVKKVAKKKRR